MRLVVAITGASGAIYGKRLLEALKELGVETHLIISGAAEEVIRLELGVDPEEIRRIADASYHPDDLTAPLSSGSYHVDGMVIAPCSMKTLAAIAHGLASNLILRAADVCIKEGRPLILVPRETPLSRIHLRNMLTLAEMGVRILPACPAFYHKPESIGDLVDFVVGKVLDSLGLHHNLYQRYGGRGGAKRTPRRSASS